MIIFKKISKPLGIGTGNPTDTRAAPAGIPWKYPGKSL